MLNFNSVFATFRNDILKSKEKVNKELENTKQLRKTINKRNLFINEVKKKCFLISHSRNEHIQPLNNLQLPDSLKTDGVVQKLPQILTTETNEILATNATTQSEINTTDNQENTPQVIKINTNQIEINKPVKLVTLNHKKNSRKSKIILADNSTIIQVN